MQHTVTSSRCQSTWVFARSLDLVIKRGKNSLKSKDFLQRLPAFCHFYWLWLFSKTFLGLNYTVIKDIMSCRNRASTSGNRNTLLLQSWSELLFLDKVSYKAKFLKNKKLSHEISFTGNILLSLSCSEWLSRCHFLLTSKKKKKLKFLLLVSKRNISDQQQKAFLLLWYHFITVSRRCTVKTKPWHID